ncbi:MFS transporter [Pseudomaricurvus alkylphenolicus]|uniref:spinster family MFS transporter n=1 Tax=Pseudomaricurvus alkylphenolicus TaxID=1306991 RepID=UPI00141DD736|nr:MFS transporter [Pseudomaricurvus alkylphenolicus]NIB41459.1 MFS transporter [Pseudomaricurvus alkylphenolicus]
MSEVTTCTADTSEITVPNDGYPPLGVAGLSLGLLFTAYVLSFLDRQVLSLLVGPIRDQFGISDFQFSLLQGAGFAVIYTIAGLPLGRMADRYSRRVIIMGSVFSWSLATVICGVSKSYSQLFLARMAVGVGEAGLTPSAYSIITDSFRPNLLGYALSFYKVGVTVGGGLALVIGGALYDYFNSTPQLSVPFLGTLEPWQATFVAVGVPGFLLCLFLGLIPEPERKGVAVSKVSSTMEAGFSLKQALGFLWQRKRVYGPLFIGSSCISIASYGSAAWYPEMLTRNYGLSKSEAGSAFGMIYLVAATLGVMFGPWLAAKLERRGHKDAYVRTILYTSLAAAVPSTVAPLLGSADATIGLLWPTVFLGMTYLGVIAVSFQIITPNQLRGQTTAIYIFVTNILGMAVGTSILAAFTDFLFQDDQSLNYSIATVNAIFYPLGAALFWYCLPAYRRSVEEVGNWKL